MSARTGYAAEEPRHRRRSDGAEAGIMCFLLRALVACTKRTTHGAPRNVCVRVVWGVLLLFCVT